MCVVWLTIFNRYCMLYIGQELWVIFSANQVHVYCDSLCLFLIIHTILAMWLLFHSAWVTLLHVSPYQYMFIANYEDIHSQ